MALEVSVIASAQRLQAQNDKNAELRAQDRREQQVNDARAKELLTEQQRRADAIQKELTDARARRLSIEAAAERQSRFDALARDTADAAIDRAQQNKLTDIAGADAKAAYLDATATRDRPRPLVQTDATASPANDFAAPRTFNDFVSQLNARIADRRAEEASRDAAAERAFQRSQEAITQFRRDPVSAAPSNSERGGLVDFSA